MNLAAILPVPEFVISSAGAMVLVLPALTVLAIVTPYAVAAVVALFRREDFFIRHSVVLQTRAFAALCLVVTVLALVTVQPRYFRPARGMAVAATASDDVRLQGSIEQDVRALVDSFPFAGVVVGVVQPTGNQVYGFGRRTVGGSEAPDGATVFEIGEVTQVFTGTLLARMVEKNAVRMDQSVQSLLPDSVSVPMRGEQQIQLQHLATWTSGLPRLSRDAQYAGLELLPPFSRAGRSQSVKWLYDLLSVLEIAHPPGTHLDESDFGMGLLGHALEVAAKSDYETLLQREVCGPLGLQDTRVKLTAEMRKRMAQGMTMGWGSYQGWHVASPVHRWPGGSIPGARDICSTANDLLSLVRAHLADFPLGSTLSETRRTRMRVAGRSDVGLGWYIDWNSAGEPIVWQHGASGACRTYVAFLPQQGIGVVVLANAPVNVDLLGKKTLNRLRAPTV